MLRFSADDSGNKGKKMRAFPPRTIFMGSYPPRACGIATFTKDVVDSYNAAYGVGGEVVAIDEAEGEGRAYPPEVFARLRAGERTSYKDIAAVINAHPARLLNVQHEYGLFGGVEGAWFLDLLEALDKPAVISLHTVLPEPSGEHQAVTERLCRLASAIIVLSQTAKDILVHRYDIDPDHVVVIHHGVPDVPFRPTDAAKASFGVGDRMVISTFGLLSRGKGLEYAIDGMSTIVQRHPEALYLILGETHPQVRKQEGESYRESLQRRIADHGLENNVMLVDRYLAFEELVSYLAATDVYLTPYLNPVQVVSGTLAYAVGCGKVVVSTPYLYARELLAQSRGFLCDFRDAESIAERVMPLLSDASLRHAVERRAYRFGRSMTWPHVAGEYGGLFARMIPSPGGASHSSVANIAG
jgi:glycosyltransferase involved in cell wall biosynthesis